MRMRQAAGVLILCGLVSAGCAAGATPVAEPAAETAEPTNTTVPATTAAPVTTAPVASTTTAAPAPTTTAAPEPRLITIPGSERFAVYVQLPAQSTPQEQAILDVFVKRMIAFAESTDPYTTDHPFLSEEVMTPTVLQRHIDRVTPRVRAGYYGTGVVWYRPVVEAIDGSKAVIRMCVWDDSTAFDGQGNVASPPFDPAEELVELELSPTGAWRISGAQRLDTPCAF